ncbi:MAG TPA: alpha/beta hydrolase, partial [Vicinamibacterales bacterium]|nr:alpha/beta hydrolase [Vicinamibacterales bacterium]
MTNAGLLRATCVAVALATAVAAHDAPAAANDAPARTPTLANVPYGPDPRQVLDFYRADTREPAPLVLYLHGGAWVSGTKNWVKELTDLLDAGISVASVEYRLVGRAWAAGVRPPVAWPMQDAARALQFVRRRAAEWHVDPTRICAFGNSAGGCTALWLALHDDMADPASSDPVARQSTRLTCAATISAQTTLDPKLMRAWVPTIDYGAHAFGVGPDLARGLTPFENFLAQRDALLPWIEKYSPIAHVTPDDPPIYLWYVTAPSLGAADPHPEHSASFGEALRRRLASVGVEAVLVYPRAERAAYP